MRISHIKYRGRWGGVLLKIDVIPGVNLPPDIHPSNLVLEWDLNVSEKFRRMHAAL
jgi:hypothetical protein